MPEAFDRFFFKVMRKPGQSLLEFCTDFNQALRELLKFKIDLPPEVSGWLHVETCRVDKRATSDGADTCWDKVDIEYS